MDTAELTNKAKKVLGARILESGRLGREHQIPLFWVSAGALHGVVASLTSETELGLDRLENLSAMHWDGAIVLSCFLRSTQHKHGLVVRATQEPGRSAGWVKFPSLARLMPAALAQEQEISEGFGVRFVDTGQLESEAVSAAEERRAGRLPGVEGFPLRKDFAFPREIMGIAHMRKEPT